MKAKSLCIIFIFFFSIACKTKQHQEKPKPETPKAFEEKSEFKSYSRVSGYENLLENLYSELVDTSKSLQELETKIKNTKDAQSDSVKAFLFYNEKSEIYYQSAFQLTRGLSDSILKENLKLMIGKSLAQYKSSIVPDSSILLAIDKKTTTLQDFQTILKIVKTLPLMEKYQRENKPSIKKLQGFENQVDETTKAIEVETKK